MRSTSLAVEAERPRDRDRPARRPDSACSPVSRSRSASAIASAPIAPRVGSVGRAVVPRRRRRARRRRARARSRIAAGVGHQAVELAGAAVDGDAGRDRDVPAAICSRTGDEALGARRGRAVEVGAGHDHRELVGAGAPDDVAAADAARAGAAATVARASSPAAEPRRPLSARKPSMSTSTRLTGSPRRCEPRKLARGGLAEGVQRQDAGARGPCAGSRCARLRARRCARVCAARRGARARRLWSSRPRVAWSRTVGSARTWSTRARAAGGRSLERDVDARAEASDRDRRMHLRVNVLGIDPGLANTGYGVVARRGMALRRARRRRDRRPRAGVAAGAAAGRDLRRGRRAARRATSPTRSRSRSSSSARTRAARSRSGRRAAW